MPCRDVDLNRQQYQRRQRKCVISRSPYRDEIIFAGATADVNIVVLRNCAAEMWSACACVSRIQFGCRSFFSNAGNYFFSGPGIGSPGDGGKTERWFDNRCGGCFRVTDDVCQRAGLLMIEVM